MDSTYTLRKLSIDPKAAIHFFSPGFAAKAFEGGLHRSGRRSIKAENGPMAIPSALAHWVRKSGGERLACASLAYLQVASLADEKSYGTAFVNVLTEFRDSAKTIAAAANTLVAQIESNFRKTGRVDFVRKAALEEMSAALGWPFDSLDRFAEQKEADEPCELVCHELSRYERMAYVADTFLVGFRAYAKQARANGIRALDGEPGPQSKPDLEQFLVDLANIYNAGMAAATEVKATQTEHPNTRDGHSEPAPFVRFVDRVFEELCRKRDELKFDADLRRPSPYVIGAALARSQLDQK